MCTNVFAMCRHVLPQRARLIGVNYSGCSILKSQRDLRLNYAADRVTDHDLKRSRHFATRYMYFASLQRKRKYLPTMEM